MKLSSYYKSNGHTVNLKTDYDNIKDFDKVFISKVFTDTKVPDDVILFNNVEYGGTGFYYDEAPPLKYEIEHSMPDYHLYDKWVESQISSGVNPNNLSSFTDYSIGFMTRGCIRKCEFCVNRNYSSCILHSPVNEFLDKDRKYICLLDDNVFACKNWEIVFEQLQKTGKPFQFKQGLDERLLTDEKCNILFNKSKWIGDYIFAFDNIRDYKIIEEKLKLIRNYTDKPLKFYVFCGYNHYENLYDDEFWDSDIIDLLKRIEILIKYKCFPYIMRHENYNSSPRKGLYINIANWCNAPSIFKTVSLSGYADIIQRRTKKNECSAIKYNREFRQKYPGIYAYYFNIKYGDTIK